MEDRVHRTVPDATDAFLAALGAVLGLLALNSLAFPLFQVMGDNVALRLGASAVVSELGLILPLGLVLWLRRLEVRSALALHRPRLVPTSWAVLAIVGGGIMLDELMYLAVQLVPSLRTGGLDAVGEAIASAAPLESALLLLPLAIAPALCEEALCRGLILRGLTRRFADSGFTAVVLSAAFFGMLHLDRLHAPVAALMGLLFGWIAIRTGSLWTPILCHLINNMISILTPVLGGPSLSDVLDRGLPLWLVGAGVAALIAGVVGLMRSTHGSGSSEHQHQGGGADGDHGQEEGAEHRSRVLPGQQGSKDQR